MARQDDFICDDCGQFCTTVEVDGKLVPLVLYVVAGVPGDYPGQLDLNAPGIKVPAFVRELMRQQVPRREMCVNCFAVRFSLVLEEAPRPPAKDPVATAPGSE